MRGTPFILCGAPIQCKRGRRGLFRTSIDKNVKAGAHTKGLAERVIQIFVASLNDDAERTHAWPEYRRPAPF